MASTATPAPAPAAPAPAKPQMDTRPAQMERAAHYLTNHPDASAREIASACDPGSVTKALSDMARPGEWYGEPYGMESHVTKALSDMARPGGLGYGIGKGWRDVRCDHGTRTRQVRTYRLLYRPRTQPDLFPTA